MARRRGEPIPEGWAVDGEGRATTNPDNMVAGGALLPLGSDRDRGGHKGYSLAIKCHDIGYTEKCHDIGYRYNQDDGKSYGRSP
jgi:hypothetical protein